MTSQEAWDEIPQEFHAWWDSGDKSGTPGNPFYLGSPAFWAWEGWRAAAKAEREACAQRAKPMALDIKPPNEEGATMCAVRWLAETPHGWVGAWDRAALEHLFITRDCAVAIRARGQA
jgi:hypothetical protein